MKIKNAALGSLFYFLYMLGSCVILMIVEALFVSIVEKFVVIPYPVLTVIRVVIYSLGVPAVMAAIGYYEGYREGTCPVGEVIGGGAIAIVYHLIFAMLFKFQAFVSGSVRFTAGLICHGRSITYDALINETPYSLFLLMFVLYGLAYVAVLTIARYLGATRRLVDRAALRGHERNE